MHPGCKYYCSNCQNPLFFWFFRNRLVECRGRQTILLSAFLTSKTASNCFSLRQFARLHFPWVHFCTYAPIFVGAFSPTIGRLSSDLILHRISRTNLIFSKCPWYICCNYCENHSRKHISHSYSLTPNKIYTYTEYQNRTD